MDAGGFVLAGLTALLGIALSLFRRVHDSIEDFRDAAHDEIRAAYAEFAAATGEAVIVHERVDSSTARLQRLHVALPSDVQLLRSTETRVRWLVRLVVMLVSVCAVAVILGATVLSGSATAVRGGVMLGIPLGSFLVELCYLCNVLAKESLLRRRVRAYRRMEY